MQHPPAFAVTSIAKVLRALRTSKISLWTVTTSLDREFTAIATDAHEARTQINEMLARTGVPERAVFVCHRHATGARRP